MEILLKQKLDVIHKNWFNPPDSSEVKKYWHD